MTRPIVILGVFVADATYRMTRLPAMGETLLGQGFALGPGGKGSNQAVAVARAGGACHFITRLGRDDFAQMARKLWDENGVQAHVVEDANSYTGSACILLQEGSGQNAIVISPGAAAQIASEDIAAQSGLIAGAAVFMTQLEQPLAAARAGLETARRAGVRTILNPAPAQPLTRDILSLCDYLTPNEVEASQLTGITVTDRASAEMAARALMDQGAGAVIITLGALGALWTDHEGVLFEPALQAAPVVDTTGAGDAFNGGLAVALAEGMSRADALRFATATAALSVTRAGTAPSMPMRGEIDALLGSG